MIGNALLSGKNIFIFDEPTSGLDYAHMVEVSKLFKALKKAGKTVLVISHDQAFNALTCDYKMDFAKYLHRVE